MTQSDGYLLDNRQVEAGARIDALATLFDPTTFRRLEALGIDTGWRCWEVGAGGRSVPTWLADRVGSSGAVLATDIDLTWLPAHAPFEVRRHDVGVEAAPAQGCDLVHARLVLVHVPQRAAALRSMVAALRPGAWLLVEDADPALQPLLCIDEIGPEEQLANRWRRGFRTLLQERGVDLAYGRTLPRLLRGAGLVDVEADAYFPITSPAGAVLEEATVQQVRRRLVDAGIATDDDIERHLANISTGRLPDLTASPMVSAWGRKALADG